MDEPRREFRCESCDKIVAASALVGNRWGDPCCPECASPRLVPHRSKVAGAVAAYFIFNVF